MSRQHEETISTRMKRFGLFLAIIIAVVIGAVIGERLLRLSQDALAMAAGLGMGCAVGLVPVGVILVFSRLVLRYIESREARRPAAYSGQPPVIIVPGGYPQQFPPGWTQGNETHYLPGSREFTVIGEEQ